MTCVYSKRFEIQQTKIGFKCNQPKEYTSGIRVLCGKNISTNLFMP